MNSDGSLTYPHDTGTNTNEEGDDRGSLKGEVMTGVANSGRKVV